MERQYGRFRTAATGRCIDRDGSPLPWYTYPAIEYLNQLDFREKTIFEFGSGNSTLYWARRAKRVVAVEHDVQWFEKLSTPPSNTECALREDVDQYVNFVHTLQEGADVIVIDGIERRRCAEGVTSRLRSGGVVILDNSDWFTETAEYLRGLDLIEVDMHGFGPINGYSWTTSLFLSRTFAMQPLRGKQPHNSRCALQTRPGSKA